MKQRVTISFVEDVEDDIDEAFWNVVARELLPKWSDTASEINVSVVPASRGFSTVADLRKHYGCDDGGAQ